MVSILQWRTDVRRAALFLEGSFGDVFLCASSCGLCVWTCSHRMDMGTEVPCRIRLSDGDLILVSIDNPSRNPNKYDAWNLKQKEIVSEKAFRISSYFL